MDSLLAAGGTAGMARRQGTHGALAGLRCGEVNRVPLATGLVHADDGLPVEAVADHPGMCAYTHEAGRELKAWLQRLTVAMGRHPIQTRRRLARRLCAGRRRLTSRAHPQVCAQSLAVKGRVPWAAIDRVSPGAAAASGGPVGVANVSAPNARPPLLVRNIGVCKARSSPHAAW
jgi:hypothetical protein